MLLTAQPSSYADVEEMRERYRAENPVQIVHDSALRRGIADAFLFRLDDQVVGYGGVWNKYHPRQVMELFLLPDHRAFELDACRRLIVASGSTHIEAQTNLPVLHRLLQALGQDVTTEAILFREPTHPSGPSPSSAARQAATEPPPGMRFRPRTPADDGRIFEHLHEPVGDFVIESDGVVIATGGYLCHYNPPYADLFMEVHAPHRRRGVGSYLVRQLRVEARRVGKVPAARCSPDNTASAATLTRAGLEPCGHLLSARL